MEFKSNFKKGISGILATVILMSSMPSYAAKVRFSDVPAKHWAYTHIENMAKLGYLNGKGDGKFDPTGNMTFMEALAAFSRLTKPTSEDKSKALQKYSNLLKELKITQSWEKEAISLALYQDMVTENDIRRAQSIYHKPIQKVAATTLLAKAIGLEDKATNMNVIFLDYKDVTDINEKDRRYVKVLLDEDILDKKGDGTGKFHPKQALKREVMATLMDNANNYLIKNPLQKNLDDGKGTDNNSNNGAGDNNNNTGSETIQKSGIKETMNVTVERVTKEIGREFLVVKTSSGKEVSFIIDRDTDIRMDNSRGTSSDLTKGLEVKIEYDSNTKDLYSVTAKIEKEEIEGVISTIDKTSNKITVEYKDGSRTSTKTLDIDPNARIKKQGSSTSVSGLNKGDVVTVKVVNGKATDINANKAEIRVTGVVEKVEKSRSSETELKIKGNDNETYKILANRDTKIKRDGDDARHDNLRETDKVVITAKYDLKESMYLAETVDADVVSEKLTGYVIELTNKIGENPKVKVRLKGENKEEIFEVLPGAYIKVDGKSSKTLPANPGYEVELYVEGRTDIKEAYVNTLTMENSLVGKIETIDTRDDYLDIRLSNISGNDKEVVRVYIDDDTKILDRRYNDIRFSRLYRGDYVNIIGVYKGSNFIANTIQLRD